MWQGAAGGGCGVCSWGVGWQALRTHMKSQGKQNTVGGCADLHTLPQGIFIFRKKQTVHRTTVMVSEIGYGLILF